MQHKKKVNSKDQIIYANCYGKTPSAPSEFLDTAKYQENDPFLFSNPPSQGVGTLNDSNKSPGHDLMPDFKSHQFQLNEGQVNQSHETGSVCELLKIKESMRLKQKRARKRKTVLAGVVGGTAGLILIGPVAGVALGAGSAILTKHILKRKENNKVSTSTSKHRLNSEDAISLS
jgi:hypothetical protein